MIVLALSSTLLPFYFVTISYFLALWYTMALFGLGTEGLVVLLLVSLLKFFFLQHRFYYVKQNKNVGVKLLLRKLMCCF